MKYKMVALDIDGTLLDSSGQLSTRHIEIIKKTQEAGIHVVLATGRYYMQTERIIDALEFEGILVTNDGAVTIDTRTKNVMHEFSFNITDLYSYISYCRDNRVHFSACTAFEYYVETMDEFQREQCLKHEIRYNVIDDVLSLKDKVMKFTISDNNSVGGWQNLEFPVHLRKRADADFFKEFVHSTTYKTAGIMKVLEQLNIHPAEMIAIGDYYNDIDMIEYAGLGIAMGNAPDAVKAAAKDVTLSNDEDGVYHALQKHLFQ